MKQYRRESWNIFHLKIVIFVGISESMKLLIQMKILFFMVSMTIYAALSIQKQFIESISSNFNLLVY